MKNLVSICAVYFAVHCGLLAAKTCNSVDSQELILLDANSLTSSKYHLVNEEERFVSAFNSLILAANATLNRGPFSVVYKSILPPSGDRHDYFNYALEYWSSNPGSKAKQQRKDGTINSDAKIDLPQFVRMAKDVEILGFAYYFTENEKYAEHATVLLDTWFLSSETKMNPNGAYGAVLPGRPNSGFPVAGMTNTLIRVVKGEQLIRCSKAWNVSRQAAYREWMQKFLTWMNNSPQGKVKREKKNNHGNHYDLLAALLSVLSGHDEAVPVLKNRLKVRLSYQFDKAGRQPIEMKRSNSLGYHHYNLMAVIHLVSILERTGQFHAESDSFIRQSIIQGLNFLAPYVDQEHEWPWFQGRKYEVSPEKWFRLYAVSTHLFGHNWDSILTLSMNQNIEFLPFLELAGPAYANAFSKTQM